MCVCVCVCPSLHVFAKRIRGRGRGGSRASIGEYLVIVGACCMVSFNGLFVVNKIIGISYGSVASPGEYSRF